MQARDLGSDVPAIGPRYPIGYDNVKVKKFIETFYSIPDDEEHDEEYLSRFADSAFIVFGSQTKAGKAGE